MKKLKNDKERIDFLEDYRNGNNGWYLWDSNTDIGRRWWRYDFPDCALIVEEEEYTPVECSWWKEDPSEPWRVLQWFIIKDWFAPFGDQRGSRTMALQEIKRIEKDLKHGKEI